jgi:hypothetical protein
MSDADTPQPRALHNAIAHAVKGAVSALPRGLRSYGRDVARATLAGERNHGARRPQQPPSLDDSQAARVRIAIDAASDRVRTAHLQPGMRVRVRSWPDDLQRDGTIEALHPGASAPITVRVDYPDGYREPGGLEPINPSNYPHERIVQPLSPNDDGPRHRNANKTKE